MWRKCLILRKSESISQSNVKQFISVGVSFLLQNSRGNQEPSVNCSSTAPTPRSLASVASRKGAESRGKARDVALVRAVLARLKAESQAGVQLKCYLGEVRSVRGLIIEARPGRNRL